MSILRNQLAIGLQNLASLYERRQDLERAESLAVRSVALQIELARLAPDELSYQSDLALGYNNLGVLTLRQQRNALGDPLLSKCRIHRRRTGRQGSADMYYTDVIWPSVSTTWAGPCWLTGSSTEAIEQFDEAAILVQTPDPTAGRTHRIHSMSRRHSAQSYTRRAANGRPAGPARLFRVGRGRAKRRSARGRG